MKSNITVSVIVCTYNSADLLKEFFDSFLSQRGNFKDCELIVVDNNSTDKTKQVFENYQGTVKIKLRYLFEKKQGLSHARNAALKIAEGDIIAFTDVDIFLDENWLVSIKKLAADYEDFIAFGGKIVPLWEKGMPPPWVTFEGKYPLKQSVFPSHDFGDEIREYPRELSDDDSFSQKNPIGANIIFRREAFKKYGLFRPDLGVSGVSNDNCGLCEDTEFIWRIVNEGEKVLYYPKAVVYHPVPEIRSTKEYIRQWHFRLGGSRARMENHYEGHVKYFGIPRWFFRKFIIYSLLMLFTFNPAKRFFYRLRLDRLLGVVTELKTYDYKKGLKEVEQSKHESEEITESQQNRGTFNSLAITCCSVKPLIDACSSYYEILL